MAAPPSLSLRGFGHTDAGCQLQGGRLTVGGIESVGHRVPARHRVADTANEHLRGLPTRNKMLERYTLSPLGSRILTQFEIQHGNLHCDIILCLTTMAMTYFRGLRHAPTCASPRAGEPEELRRAFFWFGMPGVSDESEGLIQK